MSANACTGKEDLGVVGVFGGETGGYMGFIGGSRLDPTFGLKTLDGLGISPVATTGWDGCRTFSPPQKLWAPSFLGLAPAQRAPQGHWQKGSSDSHPLPSQGGPPPGRPPHQ